LRLKGTISALEALRNVLCKSTTTTNTTYYYYMDSRPKLDFFKFMLSGLGVGLGLVLALGLGSSLVYQ